MEAVEEAEIAGGLEDKGNVLGVEPLLFEPDMPELVVPVTLEVVEVLKVPEVRMGIDTVFKCNVVEA